MSCAPRRCALLSQRSASRPHSRMRLAGVASPPDAAPRPACSFEDEMHVFGYEPREGEQVYGPPVLLLAGLRAEEVPKVRQLLDELGGQSVKVLPVRMRAAVGRTCWCRAGR